MKQNTPEWLEARKDHLGASDAPVVMGVSPWTTIYQLWEEKARLREPKKKTKSMDRGIELEPIAREEFIKMTGIFVEPEVLFHAENKFMMASLDGLSQDKKYALEIKYPGEKDHAIALKNMIPEHYFPQLQHQLEVCGLEMIFYFSFNGSSGKIVEVHRDDAYIKNLIEEEKSFWKCVED